MTNYRSAQTATDKIKAALEAGHIIGTDNKSCARFGTNQVPDVIRKLKKRFPHIRDNLVKEMVKRTRNGRIVRVARYRLAGV